VAFLAFGWKGVSVSESSLVTGLGYIQDIIKRMAANTLLIKGWSMSLTGVMIAISKKDASNDYMVELWLSILIFNVLFSILDAYYLSKERSFRNEYNRKVESIKDSELRNNLTIKSNNIKNESLLSSYLSVSVIGFYWFIILFSYFISRGCLQ